MISNSPEKQSPCESCNRLTFLELIEIALYTVQKIENYPKSFGKTVENYFHLLFFDEVKAYLMMRAINTKSANQNNERREIIMPARTEQIREIRTLCKLLVEQHESVLSLISDKLDELEASLSDGEGN